jgi:hypothetical protein
MAPVKNPAVHNTREASGGTRSRVATARWIAKGWEAAGASVACELCGGSDWALIGTDDADGVALPLRRDNEPDLWRCVLAYALECKDCGNLRLMSKARLDRLASS